MTKTKKRSGRGRRPQTSISQSPSNLTTTETSTSVVYSRPLTPGLFYQDESPQPSLAEILAAAFSPLRAAFEAVGTAITHTFTPTFQPCRPHYTVERDGFISHREANVFRPISIDGLGAWNTVPGPDLPAAIPADDLDKPGRYRRPPAVCPRHGEEMRGGFCRRCQRLR